LIEQLVRQDQHKENVLKNTYGEEITSALIDAEVQRMDSTTRAPETLAELKHALGNDALRFARVIIRPTLVEVRLRHCFKNDDKIHASQRNEAEQARANLLAHKPVQKLCDVTWQLMPRPAQEKPSSPAATLPTQASTKSSVYSNEATAQLAQVIATPDPAVPDNEKMYFEDLNPELQKILSVQLIKPNDVTAVIEAPSNFLVFQLIEKSSVTLKCASLSIPKRSYEEWLAQQPEGTP